ncbi:MAG: response regulator transcription factor [Chloroflexales bacterium]|nr:response regulator transcription factor [Chloroflexales bacterium]
MKSIRVLLVTDQPLVRIGIRALLAEALDIAVVGETTKSSDISALCQRLRPEVILIGCDIPALQLSNLLDRTQPWGAQVVILATTGVTVPYKLLLSGRTHCILHTEALDVLVQTIRRVAGSATGLDQTQSDQLAQGERPSLTKRELTVTRLIASGKTNQQVGNTLGITEKAVEKHLHQIFAKLGASTRVEVAVWAVRARLV